ncbi:MAG: MoaD/ThiS family protein [Chromatiales bacterium]|nr:MoaD/ThiS family protein [Chromatiales bacterium]
MLEINLAGPLRDAAGGVTAIAMEAGTIRELLRRLVERYPAMEGELDAGIAVSINGDIYRDSWNKEIPQDAEVFLLPRIAGG